MKHEWLLWRKDPVMVLFLPAVILVGLMYRPWIEGRTDGITYLSQIVRPLLFLAGILSVHVSARDYDNKAFKLRHLLIHENKLILYRGTFLWLHAFVASVVVCLPVLRVISAEKYVIIVVAMLSALLSVLSIAFLAAFMSKSQTISLALVVAFLAIGKYIFGDYDLSAWLARVVTQVVMADGSWDAVNGIVTVAVVLCGVSSLSLVADRVRHNRIRC